MLIPIVMRWCGTALAGEFYVSTQGVNTAPGTLEAPWRTLEYGLSQVGSGDTLYLRKGVYYESGLLVQTSGTEAERIRVMSFPGEMAVIDGGVPDYISAPNDGWELVDAGINLYRTKQTFAGSTAGAWLPDEDVQVIQYERYDCITSTNWVVDLQGAVYMGPGVHVDGGGYVYIRLEQNPLDLTGPDGAPIVPVPANTDPNANRIGLFSTRTLFIVRDAACLTFRNLEFANAERLFDCRGTSSNLVFDACTFRYREYGILSRNKTVSNVEVLHCEFDSGMGGWLHWTDIKNGPIDTCEAGGEFQNFALSGCMDGWRIHHNLVCNSMDGLLLAADTSNCHITSNVFINLRDDAINVYPETSNVTIAGNIMRSCFAGVSILGNASGTRGPVHIHHNVVDFTEKLRIGRTGNYRELAYPNWGAGNPFGGHGGGDRLGYWKIYNNTFVGTTGRVGTFSMTPTVAGSSELLVCNNIFHAVDNRTLLAGDQESSGSTYDGDVLWQADPGKPMFADFADGNDYESVAQLLASGTAWETSALEIDSGFRPDDVVQAAGDPHAAAWYALYRPDNALVFTPGLSYEGLALPGTDDVDYRGAVASNAVGGPLDRDLDRVADKWEKNWFGSVTNCDGSADGDGDGLNDREEYENGCNPTDPDSDGDGSRDGDENIAGTDPGDAASRFVVMDARFDKTLQSVVLSWHGVSNRLYDVLWTTNLVSGAWTSSVSSVNLEGTDAVLSWTNAPDDTAGRFYLLHVHHAGE